MKPPSALPELDDVRKGVENILTRYVAEQRELFARISPDALELADAIESMVSGGKRLRPTLCYWAFRAHGGQAEGEVAQTVVHVGAALELFQAAALFHDDVMDASDTRRGRPTAHRAFAARHTEHGWTGDPERFGESVAILLGDLALTASETEFARAVAPLDAEVVAAAREVFDLMRTEVTVGQYLDVLAQALPWGEDPVADEARAREVIVAKSARYSVELPLVLGAALAGAGARAREGMHGFGAPLGEAFQLRDDVLGVFGDPGVTGKPASDDLREGKRTFLVAAALEAADPEARRELAARLGDRDLDADGVARLRRIITDSGALARTEARIDELVRAADDALATAPLEPEAAGVLRELATAATDRHG